MNARIASATSDFPNVLLCMAVQPLQAGSDERNSL
jgi:hypothetical protein